MRQRFFPRIFGNKHPFTRTAFIFDYYQRAWEGAIIAFDLHGEFNYGDVPWNMLASLGGSTRMRGYYEGRYRDKCLIETQLELRAAHLAPQRHSRVGGCRQRVPLVLTLRLGAYPAQLRDRLPLGVQDRVNLRLDYGFGKKGQSGIFIQHQ